MVWCSRCLFRIQQASSGLKPSGGESQAFKVGVTGRASSRKLRCEKRALGHRSLPSGVSEESTVRPCSPLSSNLFGSPEVGCEWGWGTWKGSAGGVWQTTSVQRWSFTEVTDGFFKTPFSNLLFSPTCEHRHPSNSILYPSAQSCPVWAALPVGPCYCGVAGLVSLMYKSKHSSLHCTALTILLSLCLWFLSLRWTRFVLRCDQVWSLLGCHACRL